MSDAIAKWRIALKVRDPEAFLREHRRKKRWKDGSVLEVLFKQYPDIDELSMHRLEVVVRYLVHHKECHPSQSILENYIKI